MKHLCTICIVSLACFISACNSWEKKQKALCEGESNLGFSFEIPYTVSPEQDTFKVGDTIWLESSFNSQMYNLRNGKTYPVINFDFMMSGFISDLKTNPLISTSDFIMVSEDRKINNADRNGTYFNVKYKMDGGFYKWKSGFILTQPGGYFFMFTTLVSLDNLQSLSPPQRITKCNFESVQLLFKRLNTNSNQYLLNNAADPNVQIWDANLFKGCFAFYVKP